MAISSGALTRDSRVYVYVEKDGTAIVAIDGTDPGTWQEYERPEDALIDAQNAAMAAMCTLDVLPSAVPYLEAAGKERQERLKVLA